MVINGQDIRMYLEITFSPAAVLLFDDGLEVVIGFGAQLHGFGEGAGPHGNQEELLQGQDVFHTMDDWVNICTTYHVRVVKLWAFWNLPRNYLLGVEKSDPSLGTPERPDSCQQGPHR